MKKHETLIYDVPHISVRPEESDELLLNPGKGLATYQRFNGDPLSYPTLFTSSARLRITKAAKTL